MSGFSLRDFRQREGPPHSRVREDRKASGKGNDSKSDIALARAVDEEKQRKRQEKEDRDLALAFFRQEQERAERHKENASLARAEALRIEEDELASKEAAGLALALSEKEREEQTRRDERLARELAGNPSGNESLIDEISTANPSAQTLGPDLRQPEQARHSGAYEENAWRIREQKAKEQRDADFAMALQLQEQERQETGGHVHRSRSRRDLSDGDDDFPDIDFIPGPTMHVRNRYRPGERENQIGRDRSAPLPHQFHASFGMPSRTRFGSGGRDTIDEHAAAVMQRRLQQMEEIRSMFGGIGAGIPHPVMIRHGINPNLDVDNMSYEQLMNLGERLGKVKVGASETDITSLPTAKFSSKPENKDAKASSSRSNSGVGKNGKTERKQREECCFCLEEFRDGDDVRRLPCLHIFHVDEIDKWLRENKTCPICKTPIN